MTPGKARKQGRQEQGGRTGSVAGGDGEVTFEADVPGGGADADSEAAGLDGEVHVLVPKSQVAGREQEAEGAGFNCYIITYLLKILYSAF